MVFWLWMLLVSWKSTPYESRHQNLVKHSFMSVIFPDTSPHRFVCCLWNENGFSRFEGSKVEINCFLAPTMLFFFMHYLDSFVCTRPNSGSVTNREHFHGCPLEVSTAPLAAPPERSRSRPKNAPADGNKDRETVWLGALSLCYDSHSFRGGFCCFCTC